MNFAAALLKRAGPMAALSLALLSACTVVVEEPRPIPGPRPGPSFCTREFQPVCAIRGGERRTFANGCFADRAGFNIIRRGECGGGMSEGPRFCTREYNPVCGRRGGTLRTFGNLCEAEAAGWRVIDRGEC